MTEDLKRTEREFQIVKQSSSDIADDEGERTNRPGAKFIWFSRSQVDTSPGYIASVDIRECVRIVVVSCLQPAAIGTSFRLCVCVYGAFGWSCVVHAQYSS